MINPMHILIDIGHPAHVHLFKHFAHKAISNGDIVHFTVRDKEFEIDLLEHEGFTYTNLGHHYKSKLGKVWGMLKFSYLIILLSHKFKPDIYLSHNSIYTAFASVFSRRPNIAMEDTGNWEQVCLSMPFTEAIITSTSFPINYGKKQVYYDGYHETAYLHPNYFQPDSSILNELGVKEGEKYFILRFVSWDASHDIGQGGLDIEQKRELVKLLRQYGKIFISSERKLDPEFELYRFNLPPERMHHSLAFAHLFIGEGATMASECAVLGTPAVYINSLQRGYTTEQEKKYGLVYNYINGKEVVNKVRELLCDTELKKKSGIAHKKLISEKIDVTAFLFWFIENWPGSFRIMKENPDYQYNFK
jgi:uncharacterized protein